MTTLTTLGLSVYMFFIALIGLLGLVITEALGLFIEDTSVDDGDGFGKFSLLSPRAMLLFMTGLGAGGFFGARTGLGQPAVITIGILSGAAAMVVGYQILLFWSRSQANSAITPEDLLGLTGTVTVGIQPGRIGEVECSTRKGRVWYMATSREQIATNSQVQIESCNGNVVRVRPVS